MFEWAYDEQNELKHTNNFDELQLFFIFNRYSHSISGETTCQADINGQAT